MTSRDGGLRQLFQSRLKDFHFQSVESGLTGRGIPDTNYCFCGIEGWIEFKKTNGWTVGLRAEQIGWQLQRSRAGGRVFTAVRRKEHELWLLSPTAAPGNTLKGLAGPSAGLLGVWIGGPRAWDWGALKNVLVGLG